MLPAGKEPKKAARRWGTEQGVTTQEATVGAVGWDVVGAARREMHSGMWWELHGGMWWELYGGTWWELCGGTWWEVAHGESQGKPCGGT